MMLMRITIILVVTYFSPSSEISTPIFFVALGIAPVYSGTRSQVVYFPRSCRSKVDNDALLFSMTGLLFDELTFVWLQE